MRVKTKQETQPKANQTWTKPSLRAVGTVGEVLKQGGGKVTVLTGDPGEPRKVHVQG